MDSKTATFFLVVPPGLEELAWWECRNALADLMADPAIAEASQDIVPVPHVGGWEVTLPVHVGYLLNFYLKIPTRILQRLQNFRAKDFPKLFEKTRKFEWQQYLRKGPVDVVVSTHESKLKIKERLAQTVSDAILDCDAHQPFRKEFLKTPQTVFLRLDDDQVMLSIDTSGDPLYKRGIKLQTVEAPIRETLASALVRQIERSGLVHGKCEVMDPVCGSGTLLYAFDEIATATKGRPMAWQNFPNVPDIARAHKWLHRKSDWKVTRLLGSDISEKAVAAAIVNLQAWNAKGGSDFDVRLKDLIEVTEPMKAEPGVCRLVLMNPPYGQRISGHSTSVLVTRALEIFEPDVLGLIAPPGDAPKMLPSPYRWFQKPIQTLNGGLEIELRLARRG